VSASGPTFSVAIRGFRADLLREAIASVLAQTYEDFEVVVYDDRGDLDRIVDEFGDARVRHFHARSGETNSSKVRSALTLCRGRYLGSLDDDDRYEPAFLERVLAEFEGAPRLGVVFTDHYFDIGGRRVRRRLRFPAGHHTQMVGKLLRHWPVALSAAMLSREAWEEGERAKPIPAGVWADRFLWLRTAQLGWAFAYVDEPLMTYRVHAQQMSAAHDLMREPGVATLEAFTFDDPEEESLRRAHLADALLARAAHDLSRGRYERARADLAQARSAAPRRGRLRAAALRALASRPGAAPRMASIWRGRPRLPVLWRDRVAEWLRLSGRSSG
jgi:glycosyltransferase involved in cell wall biosynthesis